MTPSQKFKYVAKFFLIALFVSGGTFGLPVLIFAIQKPYISYDPQLPFGGLGPLYYPMTFTFAAIYGFILASVSAKSFILWNDKKYQQSSVLSLWSGGLATIFFILSVSDGQLRAAADDTRGAHTDLMDVIPLIWSAGILTWGVISRIRHYRMSK